MKKNILIIVLSVLVLGLGGYLVFDKVISNNNVKEEVKGEEKTQNLSLVSDLVNGKIIQNYVYTGEGEFGGLEENEIPYVQAAIPYINMDTKNVKDINDQIQIDYKNAIDIIKNNVKEQKSNKGPYYTNINYNYTVRNEILFVFVDSETGSYRAGGGVSATAYYYDMKNDKILNTQEVLTILNITSDSIKALGNLDENVMSNLDNSIAIFPAGNSIVIFPTQSFTFNPFVI